MTEDTESSEHSRLFLSCDLTGSTNFKQQGGASGTPWQKTFLQFYREFPQAIADAQTVHGTDRLKLKLWKPVGDELIFTCRVSAEADIYDAVRTWIAAMAKYREESLKQTPLGTKGGAFIATFPGPDSESSIPRDPRREKSGRDVVELNREALESRSTDDYLYDFFGPSIDTGFRVLSQCSSRYFTVSVEVAFAMASVVLTPAADQKRFKLGDMVLRGPVELKGVWGGRPYPLFAIDTEYDLPINRAYRRYEGETTVEHAKALCEACYDDDGWPFQLYLPDASNTMFHKRPTDPLADYQVESSEGFESAPVDAPGNSELPDELPLGDSASDEPGRV